MHSLNIALIWMGIWPITSNDRQSSQLSCACLPFDLPHFPETAGRSPRLATWNCLVLSMAASGQVPDICWHLGPQPQVPIILQSTQLCTQWTLRVRTSGSYVTLDSFLRNMNNPRERGFVPAAKYNVAHEHWSSPENYKSRCCLSPRACQTQKQNNFLPNCLELFPSTFLEKLFTTQPMACLKPETSYKWHLCWKSAISSVFFLTSIQIKGVNKRHINISYNCNLSNSWAKTKKLKLKNCCLRPGTHTWTICHQSLEVVEGHFEVKEITTWRGLTERWEVNCNTASQT